MFSLKDVPAGNNMGRYLPSGEYDYAVDIQTVKFFQGQKGETFIVEFTVVESSNPLVPLGATYSWVKNVNPAADQFGYGRRDVKGWICTVIEAKSPGSDPSTNWDDGFIAWIAANDDEPQHPQPARGTRMHIHTWEKVKGRTREEKARGETITMCDWRAMDEGEALGIVPQPPAAPAAVPTTPAVFAAPPVPAPQLPAQAPTGWPTSLPWPPPAA